MCPVFPGQACFKEALRLYPPGHISIREAAEDLNLDGKLVKKGTWLHVRLLWDLPPRLSLHAYMCRHPCGARGHGLQEGPIVTAKEVMFCL